MKDDAMKKIQFFAFTLQIPASFIPCRVKAQESFVGLNFTIAPTGPFPSPY